MQGLHPQEQELALSLVALVTGKLVGPMDPRTHATTRMDQDRTDMDQDTTAGTGHHPTTDTAAPLHHTMVVLLTLDGHHPLTCERCLQAATCLSGNPCICDMLLLVPLVVCSYTAWSNHEQYCCPNVLSNLGRVIALL